MEGRRWNSETRACEYLLRNSWGRNCLPTYRVECEDGYLWVPRNRMAYAVKKAEYVD